MSAGSNAEFYTVCFQLKHPSEAGRKLDFRNKVDDIVYAVEEFNNYYKDKKSIKIVDIEPKEIILLFKSELKPGQKPGDKNARELTVFSRRLYYDKNWKSYSNVETKLLTATKFEHTPEESEEVFEKLPIIGDEFHLQAKQEALPVNENVVNMDVATYTMTDEEMLEAIKALIATKNIGNTKSVQLKHARIEKIKDILFDVFSI